MNQERLAPTISEDSTSIRAADAARMLRFLFVLKPRDPPPVPGRHLTHDELFRTYGASPEAVKVVREFCAANGLTASDFRPDRRVLTVTAPVGAVTRALKIALQERPTLDIENESAPALVPFGLPDLPPEVKGHVTAILGLSTVAVASSSPPPMQVDARALLLDPSEIAVAYGYPQATGKGQVVGVLLFRDGYDEKELATYFKNRGPVVVPVEVDGVRNLGPSGFAEGQRVIEILGRVVPEAKIVAYVGPPATELGFFETFCQAVYDREHAPQVLCVTWGAIESKLSPGAMQAVSQVLRDAAALGITTVAAAGDGADGVHYPASDPYALAVGRTAVTLEGGRLTRETASPKFRGGASITFGPPPWQVAYLPDRPSARLVPDLAACGDPIYLTLADGPGAYGGSSSAAPLVAGLVVRANELLKTRVGLITPALYENPRAFCFDVTESAASENPAGTGWDETTGWGSPRGAAFLPLLEGDKRRR